MSSAPLPEVITRSPDFWFEDGSIILQVEGTQFRVHRSILCAHSVVFRDMHEVSEPGERADADGCPLVALPGDTAEDWTNLLRYLYLSPSNAEPGEYISFPLVASMLRLGRKYVFSGLQSLAMRTLHIQVPVDRLSSWDDFWDENSTQSIPKGRIPGSWLSGNEAHLLNLVVELDIQTIQPIAYYICARRYELENILTGTEYGTPIGTLRQDALHTLLLARERLQTAFYKINMSWLTHKTTIPFQTCSGLRLANQASRNPCDGARTRALVKLLEIDVKGFHALDRLDEFWFFEFCDPCAQTIRLVHGAQRENIWSNLPHFFGLPLWSELRDPAP